MGTSRAQSKANYDKPRLKEQIEKAMAAFEAAGHAVEVVPSIVAPDAPPPARSPRLFHKDD